MASLAELHTALETRLDTVTGLRVFDHPQQGGTPPLAFPQLTDWQPIAMGRAGSKTYRFDVFVFTAQTTRPKDGYQALLEYADSTGAKSIDLAIWDGNSAGSYSGLSNTSMAVVGFRVLGAEEVDAFQMYGGVFTVEAQTRGA